MNERGEPVDQLIARLHGVAITVGGQLVSIDRPDEWLDGQFHEWRVFPLAELDADQMRMAIALAEAVLNLPAKTLSAETIQPALIAAAAAVNMTVAHAYQRFQAMQREEQAKEL